MSTRSGNPLEGRRAFLINLAYFAVIAAIAILVIRYLALWMMPFILAFVVAAMLQKPVKWLVKITRLSRKFFSVLLVVLLVLLLAGLVALIGWQLVVWVADFFGNKGNISAIEGAINDVGLAIQGFLNQISSGFPTEAVNSLSNWISSFSSQLGDIVASVLRSSASAATNIMMELPSVLVAFIVWVVASVFLTIDYHKVVGFFLRQLPDRYSDIVLQVRDLFTHTIFKLLKTYILLMLMTFAELTVGFFILGIDQPVLIAAVVAIVDVLPVLGTGAVLIPWSIIGFVMGNVPIGIGILVLYIVVTIIRNIAEPRLVSAQIGLNPLATLFFMYLGLQAAGVLGLLLFPVVAMVLVQLQEQGKIHLWK